MMVGTLLAADAVSDALVFVPILGVVLSSVVGASSYFLMKSFCDVVDLQANASGRAALQHGHLAGGADFRIPGHRHGGFPRAGVGAECAENVGCAAPKERGSQQDNQVCEHNGG
eukprot:CAMPEP_0203893430 /NCGR_PEP_ID=MMETSP0359-20131031/36494_1 /ASSEMBLY_ACC=CAM_ASM_000338 /TAXON_ID=268821 /ORGANISM="Scrippsiella Hangoei, Strain SHTV-5" /LENGTH=113 /DNA_ID=CAMNT_0050815575 /DNA_START=24 /DNA_END=361 /DNA_ORIENTATION=+